jgi:hypothetical protein
LEYVGPQLVNPFPTLRGNKVISSSLVFFEDENAIFSQNAGFRLSTDGASFN